MICKWSHVNDVFEFDARTKAEEEKRVRAWAKEHGWKFGEMVKEE